MKKNDELIGIVCAIGSNGEGIIKHDGMVVFVPFSIVGEKIKYKVLKVTSKCAYGKLLDVIEPSKERVTPKCPVFYKCGGCQLQHINYQAQLEVKRQTVKDCFSKVANLDIDVENTRPCDKNWGYRNKLQLPVEDDINGVKIGFYAQNSHRVIDINNCDINPDWTATIIEAFREYIKEFNIKGYNSLTRTGELREITVKNIGESLLITAVVLNRNIRGIDRLLLILSQKLKCEFSLYLNINKSTSNVIYGEEFILKYGKPYYQKDMLGITCKIGVESFMQVNDEMCEKLYSTVLENVTLGENTTVIDAYSGAGIMTALLSKKAKKAIGIEIIEEAVNCANDLAKINGLEDKITNYVGRCEDLLPNIIRQEKEQGNEVCIVLDPPRKGCEYSVIESIKNNDIDRIVYVSCMPSTLARDVGLLTGSLVLKDGQIIKSNNKNMDYKVIKVTPFDLFPHTRHVETICVLSKNK